QRWFMQQADGSDMEAKTKRLLRFNGEIFAEFIGHDNIRWVTEAQFNMKGTKTDGFGVKQNWSNNVIAWNNYLKIRQETYSLIPYVLFGPRLEYTLQTPQDFSKFHVTGSVGAGTEIVSFGRVKFLTEIHYVPDFTRSFQSDPLDIKQKVWELRVGVKFVPKSGEDCPPVYK
ncbi:MAG: hypothetical protein FD123_4305, partial [Bacteroidetes bacterium]